MCVECMKEKCYELQNQLEAVGKALPIIEKNGLNSFKFSLLTSIILGVLNLKIIGIVFLIISLYLLISVVYYQYKIARFRTKTFETLKHMFNNDMANDTVKNLIHNIISAYYE